MASKDDTIADLRRLVAEQAKQIAAQVGNGVDGARRIYSLEPSGLADIDQWLAQFRRFWEPKFAALAKEVERGKKKRKKNR